MNMQRVSGRVVALVLASTAVCSASADAEAGGARVQGARTETFTSHTVRSVAFGKGHSFAEFSKDIADGEVIGADSLTGTYHPATGVVSGSVTFLRRGGLMTGAFSLDTQTGVVTGTIDGGEGRYRGVTGTVRGTASDRKNTTVTLTYEH